MAAGRRSIIPPPLSQRHGERPARERIRRASSSSSSSSSSGGGGGGGGGGASITSRSSRNMQPSATDRFGAIYRLLQRSGRTLRMKRVPIREATKQELLKFHDEGLWNGVEMSSFSTHKKVARWTPLVEAVSSLYFNGYSALCTRLACGGIIELCDAIVSRRIKNGFAVVRPPGHHAEPNHSMSFCFYNNGAVAIKSVRERYPDGPMAFKSVLILDWGVNHGNVTQRAL
ncbi:Histone deacetylase hda1 [Tilletia horrida]|uniref:histone deacetylase n=1 Tax=Tilletia horrida TaxID=155126 RepID=A0AAN6G9Y8_9BASI|nr:Histone deacetylase hda1 [Tilletia horrida]